MTGFSRFVQENVTVQAQADITVNIPLKVGGSNETVTVTESPVAVSFNTTNIALTIDTSWQRSFHVGSQSLQADVSQSGGAGHRRQETTRSCPGRRIASKWEAARTRRTIFRSTAVQSVPATRQLHTNTDSIQEVNVQQNSVDAEMGHSAGGSVSMTLKSGTNEWHGSAAWTHAIPNGTRFRTYHGVNVANRNNIGTATLGNPIIKTSCSILQFRAVVDAHTGHCSHTCQPIWRSRGFLKS